MIFSCITWSKYAILGVDWSIMPSFKPFGAVFDNQHTLLDNTKTHLGGCHGGMHG